MYSQLVTDIRFILSDEGFLLLVVVLLDGRNAPHVRAEDVIQALPEEVRTAPWSVLDGRNPPHVRAEDVPA